MSTAVQTMVGVVAGGVVVPESVTAPHEESTTMSTSKENCAIQTADRDPVERRTEFDGAACGGVIKVPSEAGM
ncbi:MAG: hypothetical protein R6X23_01855, partial [Acidimicrobiia bacterium]